MFDFPNSPAIGQTVTGANGGMYQWNGVTWDGIPAPSTSVAEAPVNGVAYGRLNANWTPVLPLTGGTLSGGVTFGQGTVPVAQMFSGQQLGGSDPWWAPDSLQLGGLNNNGLGGFLYITGHPVGFYDTGAVVSVKNTNLNRAYRRAGINGGFEGGVPAMAGYGWLDSVNIYNECGSFEPDVVITGGITYTATTISFSPPLTPAQMAQLQRQMYVMTNSVDSTVSQTPNTPGGWIPLNQYCAILQSWAPDGTSATVSGWTVPGSGHTAAGQVPSTTYVSGTTPKVYFGAQTNIFAANTVLTYDPANYPDTQVRFLQFHEVDMNDWSSPGNPKTWLGLSMNYSPHNGNTPTTDSYHIYVSGLPTGIKVRYANYAALDTDPFTAFTQASPAQTTGATNVTAEFSNFIDSNDLRLTLWTARDTGTNGGWTTASVHLGLQVDGTKGQLGPNMRSQIVWNPVGYGQGIQLLTGSGIAGLSMDMNGDIACGAALAVAGISGFNGHAPIAKPTVTGAKGGNAALASLLTALANYGLVTDSSTA